MKQDESKRTGKSGWTGAQYSIYRVLLSLLVVIVISTLLETSKDEGWTGPRTIVLAVGIPATLALALGWRDRWAAALLVPVLLLGFSVESALDRYGLPPFDVLFAIPLLLLHVVVPPAPFGSWDARGRVDPAGDWRRPVWIGHMAWGTVSFVALVAGLASSLVATGWASRSLIGFDMAWLSWLGFAIAAIFAVATFRTSWRPKAWTAMALWRIAWITAFGLHPGDASLALLLVVACEPSAWWPGRPSRFLTGSRAPDGVARLFYDGDCGFCHRTVRFVLSEEVASPEELRLRFAPLASRTFEERLVGMAGLDASSLPDSIVVELEDGAILVRSAGAIEIASRLGGLWLALALVSRFVPRALLDLGYDGIARVRKRLFASPKDSCPILPAGLRARFDP